MIIVKTSVTFKTFKFLGNLKNSLVLAKLLKEKNICNPRLETVQQMLQKSS